MGPLLLRNIFLSLHIFSIVILSAAVVGGTLAQRLLGHALESNPDQLPMVGRFNQLFGLCGAVGGGLLLLTGLGLLASTHFVYWGTPWLSIKLALFVGMAVLGPAVAKPQAMKLQALIPELLAGRAQSGGTLALALDPRVVTLRRRMGLVHVTSVAMFATVVLLAVFKP